MTAILGRFLCTIPIKGPLELWKGVLKHWSWNHTDDANCWLSKSWRQMSSSSCLMWQQQFSWLEICSSSARWTWGGLEHVGTLKVFRTLLTHQKKEHLEIFRITSNAFYVLSHCAFSSSVLHRTCVSISEAGDLCHAKGFGWFKCSRNGWKFGMLHPAAHVEGGYLLVLCTQRKPNAWPMLQHVVLLCFPVIASWHLSVRYPTADMRMHKIHTHTSLSILIICIPNKRATAILLWSHYTLLHYTSFISVAQTHVAILPGNDWGWRSYYFALQSGPVRKLVWCNLAKGSVCWGEKQTVLSCRSFYSASRQIEPSLHSEANDQRMNFVQELFMCSWDLFICIFQSHIFRLVQPAVLLARIVCTQCWEMCWG